MLYTLPEVKQIIKSHGDGVNAVEISIEGFGEGYDTHIDLIDKNGQVIRSYQMGEEEKFSKATARAERYEQSLKKNIIANVYNLGLTK